MFLMRRVVLNDICYLILDIMIDKTTVIKTIRC